MAEDVEKATRQTPAQQGGFLSGGVSTRNPGTRGSSGGRNFDEIGVAGLKDTRGVVIEEFLPQLSGHKAIHVYRQMRDNDSIIGALMFAITNMLRPVKWKAEPANTSSAAKKEAEFADSLFDDMDQPFEDFISEALTMLEFGWSMSEVVLKTRVGPLEKDARKRSKFDDGRIGIRKLAPRAQDTLWRWEFNTDGALLGMWQMPPMPVAGKDSMIFLPIERCLHLKTVSRKANPEGISILRNAYRSWWYTTRIEEMEAIGIERELAGAPVIRIPSRYFRSDATDAEKNILLQYKNIARDFKKNEQGGLVIPSDPWFDADGRPLPGAYQVDVTLLNSGGARQIDTNTVVSRHQTNIARSVLADFIMLGQQRGAYALSKNKTEMFLRSCETFLGIIAAGLNRAVLPQVWEVNNLDQELMPKYQPGRIAPVDLAELGGFLRDFAGAGAELFPDVDLENYVREMADLPNKTEDAIRAQSEAAQQMLAARLAGRPGAQPMATDGAPPNGGGAQIVPEPKATGGSRAAEGASPPLGEPVPAPDRKNGSAVVAKGMPAAYYEAMLRKFNPNHAPAGSPDGGQFTSGGGGDAAADEKEVQGKKPPHRSGEFTSDQIRAAQRRTRQIRERVRSALDEAERIAGTRKMLAYRASVGTDLSKAIIDGGVIRINKSAPITFDFEEAAAAIKTGAQHPYLFEIALEDDAGILKQGDDIALLAGARLKLNGVDMTGAVPIISATLTS